MKFVVALRFGGDWASGLRTRFPDLDVVEFPEGTPLERIADAEACFGGPNPERLRAILATAPRLRWFHTISAGVDGMLLPELLARDGFTLTNNSGSYDVPIAEFAIGAILAVSKQLPAHLHDQRAHEWRHRDGASHREVRDALLVVVGLGSIGGEVARLAAALGMRVVGVRRTPAAPGEAVEVAPPERLVEVAARADYLVVAAPLTPETEGLVSRAVIAALPAHAWVVNVARGQIVDEEALLDAVRAGRIGGAAIDAWWREPLPEDSPWWDLPNVIVSPHRSGESPRVRERTRALLEENVGRFIDGRPLRNVVDLRRGY